MLSPTNDIHIYKALRPSRSLKMLMVQVGNTKSATGLLKVAKRQHVTRRPTADEWEETPQSITTYTYSYRGFK